MYFQAESLGRKYEINVLERKDRYDVSLKPEGQDWIYYEIPKTDYQYLDDTISVIFKNSSYLLDVVGEGTQYRVYTRGSYRNIHIYNEEKLLHESLKAGQGFGGGNDLVAGMPGKIVKIFVKPGDEVKEGDPLIIMEAMKMENEMKADKDLVVESVNVKEGTNVERGSNLISFKKT